MMEGKVRILRLPLITYLMVETFMISVVVVNAVAPVELQVKSYNTSCLEGCTCGEFSSNHIQQELKTYNCSFASMKIFPDVLPNDLEVLSMRGNLIFSIPDSISQFKDLLELDMSGNRIKSIGREGIFRNMSRMIYLNIGKNDISTIFRNNLMGPKALEHLILSNNKINYIEDEALIDLKNLLSLDLEQNLLGSLYEEWFHGLSKLITLNLSHNRIHSIPASAFRPLGSLEHLHLAGNRISSVDPRAFSGLLNLQVLNMEDNLLSRTPTAAFQSLPVLEILTLDQNPLTKIKPLDFSHLTVTRISLCQMPELNIIDAKAFYNLINISSIFINYNEKLSYIDPLAFMNVDPLTELHLQNNNLEGLQKEMQKYLPEGVYLRFHGNPLRCDCNARWLQQLVAQGNTASIIIKAPEHLVCHTPTKFEKKLLKDLDRSKLSKLCSPEVLNLTQSRVIIGKVGERQVIECRALGSPIPQLHWILPDGSLVNSTLNEVRRRFFPPGTLVYYHLKPMDGGLYTCIAQNSEGSASSAIRLNVTGIDIHLFPIHVSPTFITLVWNGTERRAFPSYKIVYNRVSENGTEAVDDKRFSIVSPMRKRFTISHLDPLTDYQFCLGYEDGMGYWLQISCCQVTTPRAEFISGNFPQLSSVTVIGFVVIVAAMVVLVTCLASILIKNFRHRLYETPNKSDSSSSIPLDNLYRPLLTGS